MSRESTSPHRGRVGSGGRHAPLERICAEKDASHIDPVTVRRGAEVRDGACIELNDQGFEHVLLRVLESHTSRLEAWQERGFES